MNLKSITRFIKNAGWEVLEVEEGRITFDCWCDVVSIAQVEGKQQYVVEVPYFQEMEDLTVTDHSSDSRHDYLFFHELWNHFYSCQCVERSDMPRLLYMLRGYKAMRAHNPF